MTPLHRRVAAAWLALSVALCGVTPAKFSSAAEPAADAKVAEARVHYQRGVKLYEDGEFLAALVEFKRAYEISPSWVVLFNIAQCQFELQDYASALRSFQRCLQEGGASIPADRTQTIEKEISELKSRVAHVKITCDVSGAEVSVDDVQVGRTPLTEPLLVSAGQRKITVSAPGEAPQSKWLELVGNDEVEVKFVFPPKPKQEPPPVRIVPSGGQPSNRTLTYAGLAVAGVGVAVGTTFGVLSLVGKHDLDQACRSGVCPSSQRSNVDALSRNATTSTIGFGVGVAGAGVALYSVLVAPSSPSRVSPPGTRGSARCVPYLGFGSLGIRGDF